MNLSHTTPIAFRGERAQLTILRNDGYCWGRIVTSTGKNFDVQTEEDWYDLDDADAMDAAEEAAKDPANVSPAQGWPLGWQEGVELEEHQA